MPSSPSGLPYAMQRTPVRSGNGRHSLANGFDQRLQVLQRAPREHAMTEIEYVARAAACAAEHVARAFGDAFDRSEQHRRVQVPLHAQGLAETTPAPEVAMSSSSPAVEVPKWILGTPSARVASKMRRVNGSTRAS